MKIAVINEVSASLRNADILRALEGRGLDVYNVGMENPDQEPQLTYIHTGLMSGLLLNAGVVDMVIGGCGTGQGYLNAAMQYPGVFCGLVLEPLDAWLFSMINDGNCVSLALNKGYGWAADIQLQYIFDKLFTGENGLGYPPARSESQLESRQTLTKLSALAHRTMEEIIPLLPKDIYEPILATKPFMNLMAKAEDSALYNALLKLKE